MIDAIDDGFSIGYQRGENEGGGGTQITGQDGGGAEGSLAADYGAAAFDFDVRAHADQFLGVHEAVLEDVFRDDGCALGLSG